jgi:large conductance mechanosensitive channel
LIDDLVTPLLLAPAFKKLKVEHLEDLSWHGILWGKVLSNLIKFVVVAVLVFAVVRNFDVMMK